MRILSAVMAVARPDVEPGLILHSDTKRVSARADHGHLFDPISVYFFFFFFFSPKMSAFAS